MYRQELRIEVLNFAVGEYIWVALGRGKRLRGDDGGG